MLPARIASRPGLALVVLVIVAAAIFSFLPASLSVPLALAVLCLLLIPQTPLTALVLLLVLAPLRTLIATEASAVFPFDVGQILFGLFLLSSLAQDIARRRPILRFRPDPVLLAVLAICMVFGIGAWRGGDIASWLSEWLKWVVIAIMIWRLSETARFAWAWLVFAVVLSAGANALVGIYIFFGGSGADHLVIMSRYFRAFGTFGQPNPFGGFMGIALPLAIAVSLCQLEYVLACSRQRAVIDWRRVILLTMSGFASALILAALFASWSRGAWLGIAAALALMLVCWPRRLVQGAALALVGAALLFASASANLLPASIANRLTTAATDLFTISDARGIHIHASNYAVIERLAHWQAARNMAQHHPFFGVGLGNYAGAYENYRLIKWEDPLGHAHNHYLNILAETGIVGLSAYVGFWLVIFWLTWRTRRHPDRLARSVAVGLLGCWTYIAVHSIFDNLYVNNLFLHIGVLLSVLAILRSQITCSLKVE
ncbi:MAG: O-antigen ligase family protein [Chloroflexi bacterium]|nr:O-antigen ligase family protein [Chloroflexota bacterium]